MEYFQITAIKDMAVVFCKLGFLSRIFLDRLGPNPREFQRW